MSEQNFSFENRPERGYLYNLLLELNNLGIKNLDDKGVELQPTATTYKILSSINNISGGPGPKIGQQYCIQAKTADYVPTKLDDFKFNQGIVEDENKFKITLPNENRRVNTIKSKNHTIDGYIYYLSPLSDLKFYAGGFEGGFKIFAKSFDVEGKNYTLYRSNQRIGKEIEFSIK